ncbi:MAG: fasciclin domain-containing protein [Planctomycetes bacterium]|nr:fasciclin domain-containing protein [Planctomycetota bacterium]MCB9886754.1 fasciclin domain-containing protein [Planctomycetota bacterium]
MIRTSLVTLFALGLCQLGVAQADASTKKSDDRTIVQIAAGAGNFNTLVAAVKAAGLAETLSGKGPFTVFAPTDEAFAKLGKETITELLKPENKSKLVSILTYHVAGANLPAAKVLGMKSIETLQGQSVDVVVDGGKVTVAGATVLKTDIIGSNGVIHVIDSVILPKPNLVEVAKKAGKFGTLLAAAKAAGLAETLATGGPFTIFAPTDEAFAKLGKDTIASLLEPANKAKLQAILKNHVVAGKVMAATAVTLDEAKTIGNTRLTLSYDKASKTLHVGDAKVVAADVVAGNGVIHVIDTVLVPAGN